MPLEPLPLPLLPLDMLLPVELVPPVAEAGSVVVVDPVDELPAPVPAMLPLPEPLVLPLPLPLPIDEVPPEVPLVLALSLPFMPVELHAASTTASKPAKSTLCSLRFMINSFGWVFFVCVRDNAACHWGKSDDFEHRSPE